MNTSNEKTNKVLLIRRPKPYRAHECNCMGFRFSAIEDARIHLAGVESGKFMENFGKGREPFDIRKVRPYQYEE